MRGLRNRLSAIYQIASAAYITGHGGDRAIKLVMYLADGTMQPQEALREFHKR